MHPGSIGYVEQYFGRVAGFGQRALALIVDTLLTLIGLVPMVIGVILLVSAAPRRTGDVRRVRLPDDERGRRRQGRGGRHPHRPRESCSCSGSRCGTACSGWGAPARASGSRWWACGSSTTRPASRSGRACASCASSCRGIVNQVVLPVLPVDAVGHRPADRRRQGRALHGGRRPEAGVTPARTGVRRARARSPGTLRSTQKREDRPEQGVEHPRRSQARASVGRSTSARCS